MDTTAVTLLYTPATLAGVLRDRILKYPDKVLFGTDAFALGPDADWELAARIGTTTARRALAIALTGMIRNGEVTQTRTREIATMVMRTNAAGLYKLGLKRADPSTGMHPEFIALAAKESRVATGDSLDLVRSI